MSALAIASVWFRFWIISLTWNTKESKLVKYKENYTREDKNANIYNHNVEELCVRARVSLYILLGPISGLRTGNFTIKLVVSFSLWMLCGTFSLYRETKLCGAHTAAALVPVWKSTRQRTARAPCDYSAVGDARMLKRTSAQLLRTTDRPSGGKHSNETHMKKWPVLEF